MGWTRGQQALYRPLVDAAWALHCRRTGGSQADRAAKDAWTRDELEIATGHRSTTKCNAGRHFERSCAHFEAIGEQGIAWQLKLASGDRKRIAYAAEKICPGYMTKFERDAHFAGYLEGISVKMGFGRELHLLNDDQIGRVANAIRTDAHRVARARKAVQTYGNGPDSA